MSFLNLALVTSVFKSISYSLQHFMGFFFFFFPFFFLYMERTLKGKGKEKYHFKCRMMTK